MSLPLSRELGGVLDEAKEIARRAGQTPTSAHLLLAIFAVPNRAAVFLGDRDINATNLNERAGRPTAEAATILERIYERGERIAAGSRADSVGTLHILAAMVRESSSDAVAMLKEIGVNISAVRASVMSYATGSTPLPRRISAVDSSAGAVPRHFEKRAPRVNENAPSAIGFHPLLGVNSAPAAEVALDAEEQPATVDQAPRMNVARGLNATGRISPAKPSRQKAPSIGATPLPPVRRDQPDKPHPAITPGMSSRNSAKRPGVASRRAERNSAARKPARSRADSAHKPPEPPSPAVADTQSALEDARQTTRDLAARLFAKQKPASPESDLNDAAQSKDRSRTREKAQSGEYIHEKNGAKNEQHAAGADGQIGAETHGQIQPCIDETGPADISHAAPLAEQDENSHDARQLAYEHEQSNDEDLLVEEVRLEDPLEPDGDLADSYELDPEAYPNLVKFGRNITAQAARGEVDRVVGRDAEILQLIDILGKRRSNNPVLVGEAGVGKTAIVEGLSREFVKLAQGGNRLGQRAIVELELGRILSGTHLRGSFSERLIGIKDEVEEAGGDIIVFLDELHAWMTAGGGGDGTDAAGELKTALARGRFPCIGATTHDEFRKFIESDPAFERRFQLVFVDEPDIDTARHIADGIRGHYEKHHGVRYDDEALDAAVRLSHRYIYQRRLPDKAIGVLDLAGSRAARTGTSLVDRELVAEIVAEMAGIPPGRLNQTDRQRFLQMEAHLEEDVVGHRAVIHALSELIRRNYAGFRGRRPIGSMLFLGPTGVGKTELVKALADFLFHDRDAMVRLDMSEFMEAHSVSRMLGAPPGYVGHEQGGQLTEAVRRRPYQIVLLDEVEKAHPDVLNILLQLFDEGQVTDGRGRTVDFANTVIVMTSNLGAEAFQEHSRRFSRGRIGFGSEAASAAEDNARELHDEVLGLARGHFRPELWNRIDEKLVFMPLSREDVAKIARLQLDNSRRRLLDESGIELRFDPAVVEYLIDHGGFDPELGARPMRQTIQRLIEGAVARLILSGEVGRGGAMRVEIHHDQVICVGVAPDKELDKNDDLADSDDLANTDDLANKKH